MAALAEGFWSVIGTGGVGWRDWRGKDAARDRCWRSKVAEDFVGKAEGALGSLCAVCVGRTVGSVRLEYSAAITHTAELDFFCVQFVFFFTKRAYYSISNT